MLLARGVAVMSVAALASLASARAGVLFNSSEPTLRAAVPLAANVELAAVLAATILVALRIRELAAPMNRSPSDPA